VDGQRDRDARNKYQHAGDRKNSSASTMHESCHGGPCMRLRLSRRGDLLVVAQDRLLELPQFDTRLEPELLA
jgi:hypothetical protein